MKFAYRAKDLKNKDVKGFVEAGSLKRASGSILEQSLTPIDIKEVNPAFSLDKYISKFRGISLDEMATFTRQLATMLNAGLPLTDALNLLKLQSSVQLSEVVGKVLEDIQSGVSLSNALGKHPQVFSKIYISLVKAGESAGVMETVLNRLADNMEKSRDFQAKVKGALIYPAIVMIGMLGVMVLMMTVVIPKLSGLYKEFGANLPASTQILIGMSEFTVNYWWLVLIGIIGGTIGLRRYIATAVGRRYWDKMAYQIPVMGPMQRMAMLTEITRTLALLVGAGVSIVEALTISSSAAGNTIVEAELRRIIQKVEKGFPLSLCFAESEIFLPIMGQMMAVGEETGKLDDVLAKLSKYFENLSEASVKGLTTAIEPLIIIILGLGVGFLVYTVIMPIYSLTSQF